MRALLAFLAVGITGLVAGLIGYQLGVSSAVATSAAATGTVVYHAGWGFAGPWLGFLFFPFFLFLVFGLFAMAFGGRRRWGGPGWGGPGWGGPGAWGSHPDDPRYRWIADTHRRLHEDEARTSGTPDGTTGPTGPFDAPRPPAG